MGPKDLGIIETGLFQPKLQVSKYFTFCIHLGKYIGNVKCIKIYCDVNKF